MRAVRGHILCYVALAKIVWKSMNLEEDETIDMLRALSSADRFLVFTLENSKTYISVARKFKEQLQKLESSFTMQKMLPFFHASGHFLYAKSCHLHLQYMFTLKNKMNWVGYERFTMKDFFTIRRLNKFWSGIWTDMTIEETLMRTMKSVGGLTHGRGITPGILTKWTLGMVFLHNVCDEIEKFCGISITNTDKHVDMRQSRIARDTTDLSKPDNWLLQRNLFPETDTLMSIHTGVVAASSINCHTAQEIGILAVGRMVGNFGSLKFKRKDRVYSLASLTCSIKMSAVPVVINPLLLFQRISIAKKSDEE